jgi:glucose-1-phosphate thymidylyltransferase
MKALILAAGYATRLYPLTQNFPKPLLPVGRQTIMDYLLDRISAIPGLDQVFVITNCKFASHFEAWAEQVNGRFESKQSAVSVINNGTDSNETRLGAIADMVYAINLANIQDDLLVSAGDNIYMFDFREMHRLFVEKNSDVILTHRIELEEKLRRAGVLQMDEQRRVINFEEKPQTPKSNLACPALYFIKKDTLTLIPEYLRNNGNPDAPGHFIAWLYRQHPIYAYLMTLPYYDIGNLDSYQRVCRQFEDPAFSY